MSPGPPTPIAPGASTQLLALLTAGAGAAVAAGLLRLGLWLRLRSRPHARPATPVAAPHRAAPEPAVGRAGRRLLGAALLALLLLPTAAVMRQLWPHPALGARLLAIWLPLLLGLTLMWLLARAGDAGRGRS
jgi:hypothetical protein